MSGTTTEPNGGAQQAAPTQVASQVQPAANSAPPPAPEQTVPLSRFEREVAQKWEEKTAREAAERELRLTRETLEEVRRARAAQNDDGETPPPPSAPQPAASTKPLTPEELRKLVAQEAANADFNRQCNEAAIRGKAAHADFDKVLSDLTRLSPIFDPQRAAPVLPESLVRAAVATGKPEEVLYALGKDSALADKLMQADPFAQAVELTKLASKIAESSSVERAASDASASESDEASAEPPPNVSRAPRPITPKAVGGKTTPAWDVYNTKDFDMATWMANREKDAREARKR